MENIINALYEGRFFATIILSTMDYDPDFPDVMLVNTTTGESYVVNDNPDDIYVDGERASAEFREAYCDAVSGRLNFTNVKAYEQRLAEIEENDELENMIITDELAAELGPK